MASRRVAPPSYQQSRTYREVRTEYDVLPGFVRAEPVTEPEPENSEPTDVECTYQDCEQRFETVKEMKRHKESEPEHDYCRKCDVDCESWDDLTQHKVDAMRPWLEEENRPEGGPKHITCEFCGMDFKSFGGRRAHRERLHRAEQEIRCPGCSALFTRAQNMVRHLERNECYHTSADELASRIHHKRALLQIMKAPDAVKELLFGNIMSMIPDEINDARYNHRQIENGHDDSDDDDGPDGNRGGVTLLDSDHTEQKAGIDPLVPEESLLKPTSPPTRPHLESWPRLPGLSSPQLSSSMEQMSLKSTVASTDGDGMSDVTSRRGGIKAYTIDDTSVDPSFHGGDDDDTRSLTTTKSLKLVPLNEWDTRRSSKALTKGTPRTLARTAELDLYFKFQQELDTNRSGTSIFNHRIWDPNSEDYNDKLFYRFDRVTQSGKYCCPFPDCNTVQYDNADDIGQHFIIAHLHSTFRCSSCLKIFKSASGLMGHIEDTMKCRIKDSDNFKNLIGQITGDFVTGKRLAPPKIHERQDQALVREGQTMTGVAKVQFKSQQPRW